MPQARYVVADSWGHIFDDAEGERMTSWVYDREQGKLIAATYEFEFKTYDASPEMLADLEDSIKNANEDCLVRPAYWELEETDELPDWVSATEAPAP